jgi:replicative DNA helicase
MRETTTITDQGPPRADEAEAATLASILFDPRCLPAVSRIVRPESFGGAVARKIYSAMLRLSAAGTPIDTTLLIGELRDSSDYDDVGDSRREQVIEADLIDLSRLAPSAVHAAYYARRVAEVARRRRQYYAGIDAIATAHSPARRETQRRRRPIV